MIVVIFEVQPNDGRLQNYPEIAAAWRPLLDEIEGFISIERFGKPDRTGKDSLAFLLARRASRYRMATS